ncbi:putative ribonuclease H-like domain-containing protein [Tanacetum coccineum]
MAYPHSKRNFVPRAVLMKSSLKTPNTARQNSSRAAVSVNTARPINTTYPRPTVNCARPTLNVFNIAYSHVRRPFNKFTTNKNNNFNERVNTVRGNVTTVGPKAVVSDNKGNEANAVKASSCWVWRPKQKVLDHAHIGNKSYLTDYKEIDGGFVAFGGSTKGGKITLGKKNSVLFTDTECVVLSPDFKLLDESQVLLKVPRKDNMYSIDLKNVVPQGDHLGKFDVKADEGFFVGYSVNSKAFRVFNSRTRIVEEKLHITFLENKPNVAGSGSTWLFDIDTLTKSMNYKPVVAGNQSNGSIGEEEKKDAEDIENEDSEVPNTEEPRVNQEKDENVNNTNNINTVVHSDDDEDVGVEADMTNLDTHIHVSPILTTRIHKDHPSLKQRTTHKDLQNCLFACFLSQEEPKKVVQALKDPSWIEPMQEELLQFKLQEVWTLMELPNRKRAIGTKWVIKNKKDERGIVIKNKARLVTQGYTQEERIDYDEVFALVARNLSKIKEEVYVYQPSRFEDSDFPDRVYKVEKVLYGLHQAPKAWYESLSTYLLDNGFQRGKIDKTLFIRKVKGDILLVQVYVDDIIFGSIKKSLCTEFEKMMHKKFQMSSIASTPMETHKPLLNDADGEDVDEQLYRSMIGSLMYLTSSRHDIMFVVCACVRFQVNPKISHLHAVKRIFRYLKGQPKLGLWYPKDLPFDLVVACLAIAKEADYMGEGPGQPTDPQHTSTSVQPSTKETITGSLTRKGLIRSTQAKEDCKFEEKRQQAGIEKKVKNSKDEFIQDWVFGFQMDEVFKDVEGDAKQLINYVAEEVSTGDAVNTAGAEVNTASAPFTYAGVYTLVKMKSEKSKVRGVVMQEPSETATRPTIPPQQHDPKEKAQMQAELEEEERLARQRVEDANITEWDDVQAMMDAYYELAARLQ